MHTVLERIMCLVDFERSSVRLRWLSYQPAAGSRTRAMKKFPGSPTVRRLASSDKAVTRARGDNADWIVNDRSFSVAQRRRLVCCPLATPGHSSYCFVCVPVVCSSTSGICPCAALRRTVGLRLDKGVHIYFLPRVQDTGRPEEVR